MSGLPKRAHLDLLVAVQLAHQAVVKLCRDPEAVEQGFRVGFRLPAVHLGKFRFQLTGTDSVLVREIGFCVEGILFLPYLIQALVALDDRIQNDLVIIFEMVLFQDAEPGAGRHGDSTAGRLQTSGQNLQEGGFSGTVCTDDTVAVAFGEFDIDIFKKRFLSKAQSDIIGTDHA